MVRACAARARRAASGRVPALTRLGQAHDAVLGEVVHVAGDWWVIDIGVRAMGTDCPPPDAKPGDWLRGNITLAVEPFAYVERLAHLTSAPALPYDWMIERIEVQTAPLIQVAPHVMARDPAKLGWAEIAETDA